MYSYEARIRAVTLYIKLGKRVAAAMQQVGCGSVGGGPPAIDQQCGAGHHRGGIAGQVDEPAQDVVQLRIGCTDELSVGNVLQQAAKKTSIWLDEIDWA